MPLVSVLLPNYNNARFLREAIDSILNQTFLDFELVIVDDGSTDDSIKIINSYTDKRIKLIQKEFNSGIVDALNIGLDAIDSKYMARMDGDDISVPNRLEKLCAFLEENESIGVCSSSLKVFGNVKEEVWKIDIAPDILKAGIVRGVTTPHAPSMFRMSVLNKNSIRYRGNFAHMEDWDLFFRLKNITSFSNLPDTLYYYRILDHNVTIKNKKSIWGRYKLIYGEVLKELEMEVSPQNLDMHIELFHPVKPLNSLGDLLTYKQRLIESNKRLNIYPHAAFVKFVEIWWNSLFCRLIDKRFSNYNEWKKLNIPLTWSQRYYYFRKKLNSNKF